MKFMEFYNKCEFTLFAVGDSNWNLYLMKYENDKPLLVCIAKDGSGAKDSHFGTIEYFENLEKIEPNHGFIRV